jgi:hypothetical protein
MKLFPYLKKAGLAFDPNSGRGSTAEWVNFCFQSASEFFVGEEANFQTSAFSNGEG